MGQAVTCVAFGVFLDNALRVKIRSHLEVVGDDGFYDGWKPGLRVEPNAESCMTGRWAVIGYVVALDGGDDYKCPGARSDVPDLPLCASEETVCSILGIKYVNKARKHWDSFAGWAREHGVKMPDPEFIVTQVEIA